MLPTRAVSTPNRRGHSTAEALVSMGPLVRRRPASSVIPGGVEVTKSAWVSTVTNVAKPWGHEEHFALVDGRYCGKALHITAGHSLSLQYHERKEETRW